MNQKNGTTPDLHSRPGQPRNETQARALALPPMSRRLQAFALALVFALGLALGAFLLGNPLGLSFLPGRESAPDSSSAPPGPAAVETVYRCPMHPQVVDTRPSDCPICGMKLVAVEEEAPVQPAGHAHDSSDAGILRIDPVMVQDMGVVTEPVRRGSIAREIRTVGILDYDADRLAWVNTKFSGWIEKVHVNYVGQTVRRDQPLFEIYSPELVTTQEEYLRALEYRSSLEGSERGETRRQAESLLLSARDRLAYWDISDDQVRTLERTGEVRRRLTVRSPADGVVAGVMDGALEGMFVKAGMNLYKIADLSSLWVHAEIYESDLPWIREGLPAVVSFRFDPDRTFHGKVLFLYPEVSRETRTLKICVALPNAGDALRAGMYADVVIDGPPVRDVVLVSNSAVLRSGERNLVFVALGEGRFEPREIELGIRGEDDVVQAVSGLEPGERVVTQAQFMLDSESRLREAIAKFRERGGPDSSDSAGHAHGR